MEGNKSGLISVILCHHTGLFIHKCVESIRKSIGVHYEIIIITSDSYLKVEGAKVYYFNEGPAGKRNLGACYARGDYLAFFDDDTILDPNCLEQMQWNLQIDRNWGMVYSKLLTMGTNRFDDAGSHLGSWGFLIERSKNVEDIAQFDYKVSILAGKSASCMIKRNVFEHIGGFDTDFFMFGEETDLSWRVWLAGYQVAFVPSAVTYHAFNTPLKDVKQFYSQKTIHYHGCKNYITMLIKNLEWQNLIFILPKHLLVWCLVGFIFVLKGEFQKAGYTFRGIGYNLWHIRAILYKKRALNCFIRIKKDKDIAQYIFSATPFSYYVNRFLTYIKQGRSGK